MLSKSYYIFNGHLVFAQIMSAEPCTMYEKLKRKCDICKSKVKTNIVKETQMKDSDYFAKDSVDVGQTFKKKCFKMFYESGRAYTGKPK